MTLRQKQMSGDKKLHRLLRWFGDNANKK